MTARPTTPAWQSRPSETDQTRPVQIVRVPANGLANFLCLQGQPIGCYTHYLSRRSVPCLGDDCPICDAGTTRRWYGWLYGKSPKSDFRAIVEYTASCSTSIDDWLDGRETLRGTLITFKRVPEKPNGRLTAAIKWSNIDPSELPETIDVPAILQKMWEQAAWLYDKQTAKEETRSTNRMNGNIYTDVPASSNGNGRTRTPNQ